MGLTQEQLEFIVEPLSRDGKWEKRPSPEEYRRFGILLKNSYMLQGCPLGVRVGEAVERFAQTQRNGADDRETLRGTVGG